jgi:hypothetical protein
MRWTGNARAHPPAAAHVLLFGPRPGPLFASAEPVLPPPPPPPRRVGVQARLLALLGWDVDVLPADSAAGSAAAPYAAASGYRCLTPPASAPVSDWTGWTGWTDWTDWTGVRFPVCSPCHHAKPLSAPRDCASAGTFTPFGPVRGTA